MILDGLIKKLKQESLLNWKMNKHFELLNNLKNNTFVDSDILEYPNIYVIETSLIILKFFSIKNYNLSTLNISIDGTIIFEFFIKDKYHCIEVFNENIIVFNFNNKYKEIELNNLIIKLHKLYEK